MSSTLCAKRNATSHAPSPIERLERQKIGSKAGTQRRKHDRSGQTAPQSTFENKENRWRRHVAVTAQNIAFVAERAFLQLQRNFNRVEHLRATGMADKLRRAQTRRLDE